MNFTEALDKLLCPPYEKEVQAKILKIYNEHKHEPLVDIIKTLKNEL